MWLKIAVPGIVLVILSLVFFDVAVLGSRFTGINRQESEESSDKAQLTTKPQTATSSSQLTLQNTPSPVATTQSVPPSSKPSLKASPKASVKAIIGTLEVLQNNTSSSTSTTTNQSTGSDNISGTIDLSGTIPSGSSVVIVARPNGTGQNFQTVVSGISASDNPSWTWSTAKSGTVYDLIAILKGKSGGNDIDYAKSQTYVVTAPAYNQLFSINAGFAMSAPTGSITMDCYTKNNNNTWYANVQFASVNAAESYWLQVGTASEGSDLVNVKQNAQSGTVQKANVTFNDSITYYARYATASVKDADTSQYSSFSAVASIKCP